MKKIFWILGMVFVMAGCGGEKIGLRTGDLVFVGLPHEVTLSDEGAEGAIAAATGEGELNFIHVAIVEVDPCDSVWIVDATLRHGVARYPLREFLSDFNRSDGSFPAFVVMRPDGDEDALEGYVQNAKAFIGQPYDTTFLPGNDARYCSELVRDSYVTSDGEYLFDTVPMNFKNSDGEFPTYWVRLFSRIGEPVPQGLPGTNPQAMSSSAILHKVDIDLVALYFGG